MPVSSWSKFKKYFNSQEILFLGFRVVENCGYPRTDLNLRQNSKTKIQIFWILLFWFYVLGSYLSQVAPFPTTRPLNKENWRPVSLLPIASKMFSKIIQTNELLCIYIATISISLSLKERRQYSKGFQYHKGVTQGSVL